VRPAAIAIAILIYGIDRFLLPFSGTPQIKEETIPELYSKEITPVEDFYRTDISLIPPRIDLSNWTLTIDGDVENATTFTDDQLKALTSVEEYATLTCISNSVGGPLIGNALWEGFIYQLFLNKLKLNQKHNMLFFTAQMGIV
tara:strand:+ start:582 stop:1010 length:429 start_codon:yes stop_codon:yes gene_type:complete